MERDDRITAIILAGSRPGVDPLAAAAGVATKALVPIGGRPMIDHVARTVADHPRVARVAIMAQEPQALAGHPRTAWLRNHPTIGLVPSGHGISQSLLEWMDGNSGNLPALVTTADNVLLTRETIDAFIAQAQGADIAAGLVERRVMMHAYPGSRRTWLRFRGGAWSGANLFWLGTASSAHVLRKWREIEQDRKKGWKIISAFGPALLLGAALRLLTIDQALTRVGARLGVGARAVALPFAEACIDADKPEDVALIERILAARGGQ